MGMTTGQRLYRLRANLAKERAAQDDRLRKGLGIYPKRRIAAIERGEDKIATLLGQIVEITKSLPRAKPHV